MIPGPDRFREHFHGLEAHRRGPLDDVPQAVRHDADRFAAMAREDPPDVRNLALVFGSLEEALTVLGVFFGPGS